MQSRRPRVVGLTPSSQRRPAHSRGWPANALLLGVAVALSAGCSLGRNATPITAVPHSADDAKAIASRVAVRADCKGFEYFDNDGSRSFTYTCQRGEHFFLIAVFASDDAKQAWLAKHGGSQVVTAHSYAVGVSFQPGKASDPAALDPFRAISG